MIRFFASHPTAANILMMIFVVLGIVSLPTLKKETFPEIEQFEVKVSVAYPGASAIEVEESICELLEDATDGISFIDERRCESKDNMGTMVLKMIESGDMPQFIDDIKSAVEGISEFPDDTETPIVKELGRTAHVISIAVIADIPLNKLKMLAENYKRRLLQDPNIPIVNIEGFSQHQLLIEVSDANLRQYGLSITDIANRVSNQAIDLPAGNVTTQYRDHQIRFTDQRRTPEELADLIIIHGDRGSELRLGDIATINDTFELTEDRIEFDGRPAALLKISKNKIDDSLNVLAAVKAFVEQENVQLPKGVELVLTQDAASIINDRLTLLTKNSWQGLILVTLALFLFFTWRYTFWVAMGLPISFLGGFFAMTLLGMSINMITMVALLIAIGILMDDAIVISESIAAEYKKGKSPLDAAIDGTKLVARGVFSSFVTTLLIFGGLTMLKGDLGQVLKPLPIVLMAVLLVSLFEAFLILPHHLKHSLEHTSQRANSRFRQGFNSWFSTAQEKAGLLADTAVKYRYATLGGTMALLFFSISMLTSGILKFKAFPDLDGDLLEARILLPQGTPLERTEEVVSQVVTGLKTTSDTLSVNEVSDLVKHTNISYSKNNDAFETGPHLATISVDLLSAEERNTTLDAFTRLWRQNVGHISDVIAIQYKEPSIGPAGRAIQIRLSGSDVDTLATATRQLENWIIGYPGVVDVINDIRPGKPQFHITMQEGVLASGIDARNIANQLRGSYQGTKVDEVQLAGESYEIQVKLDPSSRDSLGDFDYMPIIHPQTKQVVPLSSIADITPARSFARINRVDGSRTVTLYGDVDPEVANTADVLQDLKTRFLPTLNTQYPNIQVSIEGESKNSKVTSDSLQTSFVLGALGIFLLLSLQFKNYLEPIIVMINIPLALIGVIWGHLLMGLDLTMPSLMGFVSLAGIVVNDSILLVEFVKLRSREGMTVHAAASQATRDRFRAIFLTSITTISGMLPLLSETSLQAQVLIPLVTSITFGLMTSTLLVLFIVPALYAIFEDMGFTETV